MIMAVVICIINKDVDVCIVSSGKEITKIKKLAI